MTISARIAITLVLLFAACAQPESPSTQQHADNPEWWKGNLHTHTLWSDGDDYPEMVVSWYRERGYHFLALSDHNTFQAGERWTYPVENAGGLDAFNDYQEAFGDAIDTQSRGDSVFVRLKTLDELRAAFESPGDFLLVSSEEITDRFENKPVHMNASNIQEMIEPQGGESLREVMQNNVDAVLAQRERLGVPIIPHINHPNFGWAMTAEDLIALDGEDFFEVYNGHPAVHNEGDSLRPSTERMWDIINTRRLLQGRGIMYGIAVDDSHNYHEMDGSRSNPGRAWIMVKAPNLEASALMNAMEAGAFYGSTGVSLSEVTFDGSTLSLQIEPEAGVTYETLFYGTRAQHDTTSTAVTLPDGAYVTRAYSEEVGEVLGRQSGSAPSYALTGDELYVRAKVISSKPKENPYSEGETEMAWTQPVQSELDE